MVRRLVLFDIDGTLVEGGPAKEAFQVALMEAFGTTGHIEMHDFAGKTDPQIARELLKGAGVDDATIDEGLPSLWERYLAELEVRLLDTPMKRLPGVIDLLECLQSLEGMGLGLVTGNIAEGARLKLGSADLQGPFALGGYGSDSEERDHLPGVALDRAALHFGVRIPPEAVTVIGDTPRDVACGLAHGLGTVAVATGHFGSEALRASGAHTVLDDLRDTDRVVEALTRGIA